MGKKRIEWVLKELVWTRKVEEFGLVDDRYWMRKFDGVVDMMGEEENGVLNRGV